jgi:quercetin dioxygenase-like cupin family protein
MTMSSLDRPVGGRPLVFHLGDDTSQFIDEDRLAGSGRSARTLVKEGHLRITIVALAPGGAIATHSAVGPVAVHVLSGTILFTVADDDPRTLRAGDLLSLPAGVEHAVESEAGGEFLLTMATG